MDIPENIKHFAKEQGYPQVEHLGRWNGFEAYSASDPGFPYIGYPLYILAGPDLINIRWATIEETELLMRAFD